MKTISNLLTLLIASGLLSSCAINKNLSYDDDVYGDLDRPVIAGNATSDDFFENQDYYNEEYAKNNKINYQSNSTEAGVNNNYYGGYGNMNSGCGCNNLSYYGNPYHNMHNNHFGYGYGNYGCNNNFNNNFYGNSWGNPYNQFNPGWNSGWGMGAAYGFNTWGNPYGWGSPYYGTGFYYGGNPYNNGWNNGWGNNNWGGGWNEPSDNNIVGGPQGGGMSSGSAGTSGYGTSGNSSDLYNLTTSHVKSTVVRPEDNSSTSGGTVIEYSDKKPVASVANSSGMTTSNGTTPHFNQTISSITNTKPTGHIVNKPNNNAAFVNSSFDNNTPKEIVKSPNTSLNYNNTSYSPSGSVWSTGKTDIPANTGKNNSSYNYYNSGNSNTYYNSGSNGGVNNSYYNPGKVNGTVPSNNYNNNGSGTTQPSVNPSRNSGFGSGNTPVYSPSPSMGGGKPSGGSFPSGTVKPSGGSIGNVRGGR
jgi:hypothetical protein